MLFLIELGRSGASGGHGDADLREEFFLPGRRTDAEQTGRGPGGVGEGMRRVRRDAYSLAGVHGRFFSAEGGFNLAFQDGEGFLEVVPMRRWAAPGRNVHVDQAITAAGVGGREEDGVGVSNESDVREALVRIGPRDLEAAGKVIGGKRLDGTFVHNRKVEHVRAGAARVDGLAARVAESEHGSRANQHVRAGAARVDGNAARVAGASAGASESKSKGERRGQRSEAVGKVEN